MSRLEEPRMSLVSPASSAGMTKGAHFAKATAKNMRGETLPETWITALEYCGSTSEILKALSHHRSVEGGYSQAMVKAIYLQLGEVSSVREKYIASLESGLVKVGVPNRSIHRLLGGTPLTDQQRELLTVLCAQKSTQATLEMVRAEFYHDLSVTTQFRLRS